ncbi:E3 ubiquitin-protein ligase RGLG2-like [Rutidosis leptorrhynchoides]|uniref:E3 ubiquitin-protein ligase RGLG2-like n=1 Tax=Rutidosis leptorrhynchoides TaxID=125765 RepID=UPI003A990B2C
MGGKSSKAKKPSKETASDPVSSQSPNVITTPSSRHHHVRDPCVSAPQTPKRKLDRKYSRIGDGYKSLEQVTSALTQAGLESSNLIVGIDFTRSNEWKGKKSFNNQCLHSIGVSQNPYEQAISIIGKTLSAFDEDNLIPCFGFGDVSNVTRSGDTKRGQLSSQEQKTIDAIVKASNYPLSIIMVGVGDGPWNMMKRFDDNIPSRAFDNFQFVNFTDIMSKNVELLEKQTKFALTALMELPLQYKATLKLGLLGTRTGNAPNVFPLPPPCLGDPAFMYPNVQHYPPSSDSTKVCPVCLDKPNDMAFGCGHQSCSKCGAEISLCPICRNLIMTKIKLYQ